MTDDEADYTRAWERDRWRRRMADPASHAADLARRRERDAARRAARPPKPAKPAKPLARFTGCDGEGIGREPDHRYALFRMGERELYRDGRRLTTPELLAFILAHPRGEILVGFAFNYDASNILRDVPRERDPTQPDAPSRFERLFLAPTLTTWTWLNFDGHPTYGVQYLAGNHLRVCLIGPPGKDGLRRARKGSVRTIYDTWGFFQGSFLTALARWNIGAAHSEKIAAMKASRDTFAKVTKKVRDYCRLECRLLAEMMTAFREVCIDLDMIPRTWNGAGKLASALLKKHAAMRRTEVEAIVPAGVLDLAQHAYYGGRFEVTRVGWIGGKSGGGPVYEHDINSAYPAAMLDLPCLRHGRFRPAKADELARRLTDPDDRTTFLCKARFSHPRDQFLCGLPFRSPGGSLIWPRDGNGTYWSVELRSARRLGATITPRNGYLFEAGCGCRPYDWVERLYEQRRAIGKDRKGIPIKLGLNSLYGKHAQRIGSPPYANPITAGLITAITRAGLNDAIALAGQERVIMIATDAIYTLGEPAPLPLGEHLGAWEVKRYPRLFIVRPGLYWPPRPRAAPWKIKSKGLSAKYFEPHVGRIQKIWLAYCRRGNDMMPSPPVLIPTTLFVGLRYAWRIGRPDLACQWVNHPVWIRFGDHAQAGAAKRVLGAWTDDRRGMILASRAGSPAAQSMHYERATPPEWVAAFDEERTMLEAMPDLIDLTAPFT